jgi:hypothetical protein
MKDKLDILNRVKKTEAPEFLFTRILQRVQAVQEVAVTATFKLAFTAVAAMLLLLNIWVYIKNTVHTTPPQPGNALTAPYSSTINNIYYE